MVVGVRTKEAVVGVHKMAGIEVAHKKAIADVQMKVVDVHKMAFEEAMDIQNLHYQHNRLSLRV